MCGRVFVKSTFAELMAAFADGSRSACESDAVILDCTQFVIVDLDAENGTVQIEFSLNSRVLRAWVPAPHFQEMIRS